MLDKFDFAVRSHFAAGGKMKTSISNVSEELIRLKFGYCNILLAFIVCTNILGTFCEVSYGRVVINVVYKNCFNS